MATSMAGIIQRNNTWHFRWVLPDEYRKIAGKREIHKSLKTDSKKEAEVRARAFEHELRAKFEAALSGRAPMEDGMNAFSKAVRIAEGLGMPYKSAADLASGRLEDILSRIDMAREVSPDGSNPGIVSAVLGGVEQPGLRLSGMAAYVESVSNEENGFKNTTQMRKWRNGNIRTMAQCIEALGEDILVSEFTAEHAKKHLLWLEKKVKEGKIQAETVKKELTYAAGCFKTYYHQAAVVHPPKPYAGQSVSKGVVKASYRPSEEKRKKELDLEWITDKLLKPGVLDGLNAEARDILLIVLETGCRQSEVYNTPLVDIHVDVEHPHFIVRPIREVREIKNAASERIVPLRGVALSAMKRVVRRGGFKTYTGRDSWSATVNKYLRKRGVLGEGYSIGGLRHAWEGRMRRAGIGMDERGVMMGHSVRIIRGREEYGDLTLEERHAFAAMVVLDIPDPVAHLGDETIAAPRKRRTLKCPAPSV